MDPRQLAEAILSGQIRPAARLMRLLDDGEPQALEALKLLHGHTGRARVIGVTGSPGVGKSTLTDALIAQFRQRGLGVGVVAVDPTSPFSGGAILGDRVRMQRHATDEGVFIRSLATRGHFGGLTASTQGVVKIMDAMGKDVIIVETVGVGQDEVDVVGLADTTLVVTVPGLGDDIQAIKAGILETADVFVVNKIDRDGARRTMGELQGMLELAGGREDRFGWVVPVVGVCAVDGRGLDEMLAALDGHWAHQNADPRRLAGRRRQRARMELLDLVRTQVMARLTKAMDQGLDDLVERISQGQADPYSACDDIISRFLSES